MTGGNKPVGRFGLQVVRFSIGPAPPMADFAVATRAAAG